MLFRCVSTGSLLGGLLVCLYRPEPESDSETFAQVIVGDNYAVTALPKRQVFRAFAGTRLSPEEIAGLQNLDPWEKT